MLVSSVVSLWSTGDGATLDGEDGTPIFRVSSRGRLRLDRLTLLRGRDKEGGCVKLINGGGLNATNVHFLNCTAAVAQDSYGNARGGGLLVGRGSSASLSSVSFSSCRAFAERSGVFAAGGGVFVDGGGDVSVQGSHFDGCAADAENATDGQGGALFVANEGVALLHDATRFTRNTATGPGSSVLSEGVAVYRLPAPPGHFISGARCSVMRDPCTRDGKGFFDDPSCMKTDRQIPCGSDTYNPNASAHSVTDCIRCPERTSTNRKERSTSISECSCAETYYLAPEWMDVDVPECHERCCTCPTGSDCEDRDLLPITLANLKIVSGYFRLSAEQIDIRRCPDAAAGCPMGQSICANSTSGCIGGRDPDVICREGLGGIFCRECVDPAEYYVEAESETPAQCKPCVKAVETGMQSAVGVFFMALGVAVCIGGLFGLLYTGERLKWVLRVYRALVDRYKVPNRLKILIGFYMIATKVEHVYDVFLPAQVRQLLQQLRVLISLGIESVPLSCVGAKGYWLRLIFWVVVPLVLVALAFVLVVLALCVQSCCAQSSKTKSSAERRKARVSCARILEHVMPIVLRIFFVVYPIITNVAFEAFSCYRFEDGSGWLVADVAMPCDLEEHERAKLLARAAIAIYPIGIFLLNLCLLRAARRAIQADRPTTLSRTLNFLHREYKPEFFWWELVEMARRFLLVGLYVALWEPFHQGSIMQVGLATLTATFFLTVQLQAMPYRNAFDNQLALSCSFALTVMLLTCIFYKMAAFTDLPSIHERMSKEQKSDFEVWAPLLSLTFISSVFGALLFSTLLFVIQLGADRQQALRNARYAKARRLRFVDGDVEVVLGPPSIPFKAPTDFAPTYNMGAVSGSFHVFLSHVWGTGQDQMRIVKQRLLELLPDASVFLDVDDLKEGRGAEYVDVSALTLIFCSAGYFQSPNCVRELLRAICTGKPLITMLEPEAKHGGLTEEEIAAQLIELETPCEKDGQQHASRYALYGLDVEVQSWGYRMPTAEQLRRALFSDNGQCPAVEWNRIGAFQDVTMRLIAERLLPPRDASPSQRASRLSRVAKSKAGLTVYVQGELANERPRMLPPLARFHVFCSTHNPGALALMTELANRADAVLDVGGAAHSRGRRRSFGRAREAAQPSKTSPAKESSQVSFERNSTDLDGKTSRPHRRRPSVNELVFASSSIDELTQCDHMLLYLNGETWTRGEEESTMLAEELALAREHGVHVLLAHEMPGLGQADRSPCEFGDFFSCDRGTTPRELLQQGIYDEIAVALRGGPYRQASMVMLARTATAHQEVDMAVKAKAINNERPWLSRALRSSRSSRAESEASLFTSSVDGSEPSLLTSSMDAPIAVSIDSGDLHVDIDDDTHGLRVDSEQPFQCVPPAEVATPTLEDDAEEVTMPEDDADAVLFRTEQKAIQEALRRERLKRARRRARDSRKAPIDSGDLRVNVNVDTDGLAGTSGEAPQDKDLTAVPYVLEDDRDEHAGSPVARMEEDEEGEEETFRI